MRWRRFASCRPALAVSPASTAETKWASSSLVMNDLRPIFFGRMPRRCSQTYVLEVASPCFLLKAAKGMSAGVGVSTTRPQAFLLLVFLWSFVIWAIIPSTHEQVLLRSACCCSSSLCAGSMLVGALRFFFVIVYLLSASEILFRVLTRILLFQVLDIRWALRANCLR